MWLLGHPAGLTDTAWVDDDVRDLVASCVEVWTEIAPGDPANPLIAELGVDADRALSVLAGPDRWSRVRDVCEGLGLDAADIDGLRPWLAAQTIEAAWLESAGGRPEAGADQVIAGLAREGPARLHHEMSFDAAIRLLGSLDDDAQLGYLDHVVAQASTGPDSAAACAAAWVLGDLHPAEADERRLAEQAPAFHQRLVVARNRNWVIEIDGMLDREGDRLVCLGAGHLVGSEGLPALLVARGMEVAGP